MLLLCQEFIAIDDTDGKGARLLLKGRFHDDSGQVTGDKGQVKIFLIRDHEIHDNLFLIMAGLSSYMM